MLITTRGDAGSKVGKMAISDDYLEFVRDQMSHFGHFDLKKMFGGAGLFRDGRNENAVIRNLKLLFCEISF